MTSDELDKGCTKKLAITRSVVCVLCLGGWDSRLTRRRCRHCDGQGRCFWVEKGHAPGYFVQKHRPCKPCHGIGWVFPKHDRCRGCDGRTTQEQRKVIKVVVPPCTPADFTLTFPGEGNQTLQHTGGDVCVVLKLCNAT